MAETFWQTWAAFLVAMASLANFLVDPRTRPRRSSGPGSVDQDLRDRVAYLERANGEVPKYPSSSPGQKDPFPPKFQFYDHAHPR